MTILGFDVAKATVVVAEADRRATVRTLTTVENTSAAIGTFLDEVRSRHLHCSVIAESTGDYHRPLVEACLARDIPCRLVNPILTKQFTRATIRGRKTDATDAVILVKLALQGEGRLATNDLLAPVKPLVRTAARLTQLRQSLRATAARFGTVVTDELLTTQLATTVDQLTTSITQLRDKAVAASDPLTLKLLTSIPGIGPTIATTLVAELAPIDRFRGAAAVVAYAGLDPRVLQSGTSLNRHAALTKRGSPYLRHMLFVAASSARRCDPQLQEYYVKKRVTEGKAYRTAVVAVSRKLIARVYAVWTRGTPYQKLSVDKTP